MRALDGVRVIDLSRLLPGGFCTLVLADLGADVVKIEEPRSGDLVRTIPPFHDGTSVYFHAINRNKRSVTLDLRSREAPAVLDRLLERADVLVESFRPHTARRLGVSSELLLQRHPRLVHCAITGFGQSGPYAERAAHDLNFVALSGLFEVDQTGSPASGAASPRVPGLLVADIGGAWAAVAGIAAGLFQRERTGRGAAVDISIHDVAVSWLTFPAAARLITPDAAAFPPFPITSDEACYNIYRTADGRDVALAAIESKFWQTFCVRAGHPEFIDQHFVPGVQEKLRQQVAQVFASRTLAECLAMFGDTDICLTPINNIAGAVADPHLAERGTIATSGRSKYIRSPIVFNDATPDGRAPITAAPALGGDTDAVLAEAGLDAEAIERLRFAGVV